MKIKDLLDSVISLVMFMVSMSFSCGRDKSDCHHRLYIRNNTANSIYFTYSFDSSLQRLDYNPGLSPSQFKCIENTEIGHFRNDCFDSELPYSIENKLYILIFDATIIEAIPWGTIKQNQLFLKRYALTKVQLDSCNWRITYP